MYWIYFKENIQCMLIQKEILVSITCITLQFWTPVLLLMSPFCPILFVTSMLLWVLVFTIVVNSCRYLKYILNCLYHKYIVHISICTFSTYGQKTLPCDMIARHENNMKILCIKPLTITMKWNITTTLCNSLYQPSLIYHKWHSAIFSQLRYKNWTQSLGHNVFVP